jgi:uncharacterized protein YodC (DUF2158 family)
MVAVERGERWECRWFDRLTSGEHILSVKCFHAFELVICEEPAPMPEPSGASS